MTNLLFRWCLTLVKRWHTNFNPRLRNSGDDVAAHIGRMCALADKLWPGDGEILTAIVRHDLGEAGNGPGDVSGLWKKRNPDKAATLAEWEAEARALNGVPDVPYDMRVHLIDRLDAYLFVSQQDPKELQTDDWRDTRHEIAALAQRLPDKQCNAICAAILKATHQ